MDRLLRRGIVVVVVVEVHRIRHWIGVVVGVSRGIVFVAGADAHRIRRGIVVVVVEVHRRPMNGQFQCGNPSCQSLDRRLGFRIGLRWR